jgi:uncharacterized protein YidB (DUF937 family)
MGLLDAIVGAVSQSTGGTSTMEGTVAQMVIGLISNHQGGIQGLINQFTQSGLGEHVQSWVGTGQNLPVSADQIIQVLGGQGGQLQQLAQQFGLTHDQAASGLAQHLPSVIDQLTPNGSIQHDLVAQGLSLLKSKFLG